MGRARSPHAPRKKQRERRVSPNPTGERERERERESEREREREKQKRDVSRRILLANPEDQGGRIGAGLHPMPYERMKERERERENKSGSVGLGWLARKHGMEAPIFTDGRRSGGPLGQQGRGN